MDKEIEDILNNAESGAWSTQPTVRNARITGTELGVEDHGIMTCWLHLDYGGGGQGFGGYALDKPLKDAQGKFVRRMGTDFGMEFIVRLLAALEVGSWEKLVGAHCRVVAAQGKVYAIGHLLENKWFVPDDLVKEYADE